MASHGIPRGSGVAPTTEGERRKEKQKIADYQTLVASVTSNARSRNHSTEALDATSRLLRWNPEYYTIWNHRRIILGHLIRANSTNAFHRPASEDSLKCVGVVEIISNDLDFLIPLLRKFPKCYWIWNYRLWLLQEATANLPPPEARKLWRQEVALAGKMLSLDSRNFNGWGYRRKVIAALESPSFQAANQTSLIEQEFEYSTKMVNSNLSNFSAWHNRSKLIPRLLDERRADDAARRKFLDQELETIQRALWAGDNDQSLWFYHQYLMTTFDPKCRTFSMVPELTGKESVEYLNQEIGKVMDMLEGAEDCKWIYQSLVHMSMLHKQLNGKYPVDLGRMKSWLETLRNIDPLRVQRWTDLSMGSGLSD